MPAVTGQVRLWHPGGNDRYPRYWRDPVRHAAKRDGAGQARLDQGYSKRLSSDWRHFPRRKCRRASRPIRSATRSRTTSYPRLSCLLHRDALVAAEWRRGAENQGGRTVSCSYEPYSHFGSGRRNHSVCRRGAQASPATSCAQARPTRTAQAAWSSAELRQRDLGCGRATMSPIRTLTTSQPRSLMSIAKSKREVARFVCTASRDC